MDSTHDIHWREEKRIFHFVQGTKTHGIHYVAKFDLELVGFTDYDWEGDKTDGKKNFVYVFILSYGKIIWSSKNQIPIALSSIDEEYRGDVNATTQCVWLQGILGEFGIEYETSTFMYCDNQITIQILTDLV